jgi:hypothetical protein
VEINQKDIDRFWSKVVKEENGCWEFYGTQIKGGYCLFRLGKKMVLAHRFSYAIHHIDMIDELDVLHICDNSVCINPSHLYQGDDIMNVMDRSIRNRTATNERNGNCKLLDSDVAKIRELFNYAGLSKRELSNSFMVDYKTISNIVNNKSRKI